MLKKLINCLSMSALAVIAVAFVSGLSQSASIAQGEITEVKGASVSILTGNSLVDLINTTRVSYGVSPLEINSVLANVAATRTKDMTANKYYAHISPEGRDFAYSLKAQIYKYTYACENLDLAVDANEETFITDWLNSTKGHRECLLNDKVTKIGVSVAVLDLGDTEETKLAAIILSD